VTRELPQHSDVVIIGAGLAGLVAARTLGVNGIDSKLPEAATSGVTDEQFLRSLVDSLFRDKASAEKQRD